MPGQWAPEWMPWVLFGLIVVVAPVVSMLLLWRRIRRTTPRPIRLDDEAVRLIGTAAWGKPERKVLTDSTTEELACLAGRHKILPGQHYWKIPLHGTGEGYFFYQCLACAPGDAEVTREP